MCLCVLLSVVDILFIYLFISFHLGSLLIPRWLDVVCFFVSLFFLLLLIDFSSCVVYFIRVARRSPSRHQATKGNITDLHKQSGRLGYLKMYWKCRRSSTSSSQTMSGRGRRTMRFCTQSSISV